MQVNCNVFHQILMPSAGAEMVDCYFALWGYPVAKSGLSILFMVK